jgi:hypothetical protein
MGISLALTVGAPARNEGGEARPVCHSWQKMYPPFACTALVTVFQPAICESEKTPGTPGYPLA